MTAIKTTLIVALAMAAIISPISSMADGTNDIAVEQVEGNQITVYGPSHVSLHTSIVIEAPVAVVWATVMEENKGWSPSYFNFDGLMEDGATVTVSLHDVLGMNGGNDMSFPFEWSFVEGHRFGWSGPAVTGGPIYDNHQFVFTAIDDNTTLFSHSDDMTSTDPSAVDLSADATLGFLKTLADQNYIPFNKALKAEAELRHN